MSRLFVDDNCVLDVKINNIFEWISEGFMEKPVSRAEVTIEMTRNFMLLSENGQVKTYVKAYIPMRLASITLSSIIQRLKFMRDGLVWTIPGECTFVVRLTPQHRGTTYRCMFLFIKSANEVYLTQREIYSDEYFHSL